MEINKNIEGIKTKKDGKEYVSNPILYKQILLSREKGELTNDALQMLMLMVESIMLKCKYIHPEEKEDCRSSAILDVLQYWKGFNPDLGNNPFAYFTSVISNGIKKGYRTLHPEVREKDKGNNIVFTRIDDNIYSL